MNNIIFDKILIIGVGLIGSSIARAIKKSNVGKKIYGLDVSKKNLKKCNELDIVDHSYEKIENFSFQFDVIVICSPLSTYQKIFKDLNIFITEDTIVTDVGSTKVSVIKDFKNNCNNKYIKFVPSHPIAGLEKSGPEYGFANLLKNRFCILTPIHKKSSFVNKVKLFWQSLGMKVEIMEPNHHDRVLAITSHLPQLVAYSIVFTADGLEKNLKKEVIKFSAAGFRDFTRLAGSDPVMWRDIFSVNKNAVIEMLGRFTEDLTILQKAIKNNDIDFLEKTFYETKKIRRKIEDLGQAGNFDPTESKK